MRISVLSRLLIITLVCSLIGGCGLFGGKPKWVLKGSGAFSKKERKESLYGVGIAEKISSMSLRRTTADNRAIAEISKQLNTVSTSLMNDYMNSSSATAEEIDQGQQHIDNTVKTFTSNSISGIRIIDRWDNGKVAYSLAELKKSDLKTLITKIAEMSETTKKYVETNVDDVMDSMERMQ